MNKLQRALTDFDLVLGHKFEMLRHGVELPEQFDFDNFEKARRYATQLVTLGLLTEFAERIKTNKV